MKCVACGCTDQDCRGCVERTGEPCSWAEPGICSACTGPALIALERQRQVEEEGYDAKHDDAHGKCEIRKAAECYARPPALRQLQTVKVSVQVARGLADPDRSTSVRVRVPKGWPWAAEWWKPTPRDRVRELVKAGALYMAECSRQNRAGRKATAKLMEAKAKACARKIDRIHREKAGVQ